MSDRNRIYVYFDHDPENPERLGVISVQSTRGKEFFTFEFDKEWLQKHPDQILDPDLHLSFRTGNDADSISLLTERF